jgi:hypothetical protein
VGGIWIVRDAISSRFSRGFQKNGKERKVLPL